MGHLKRFVAFSVCLVTASAYGAGSVDCAELAPLAGQALDAAVTLQGCVNRTPTDGILSLPAGRYRLDAPIRITKPMTLRTRGTTDGSAVCGPADAHQCAELAPNPAAFRPAILPDDPYGTNGGLLLVLSDRVTVDRIVVNGNRHGLLSTGQWTPELCQKKNLRGMLIAGAYVTVQRSTIKNALCNAGLHILALQKAQNGHYFAGGSSPTHDLRIVYNHVFANGAPLWDSPFYFADGIAAFETPRSTIAFNNVYDNTDVQLIIGGCPDCTIRDNFLGHTATSYHNSSPIRSHGALMIHTWPQAIAPGQFWSTIPTSGDYTNTVITHNWIDCLGYCGVGVLFGANSWYPPQQLTDPEVRRLTGCHDRPDPDYVDPEHCDHYHLATKGGDFYDNTILNSPIGLIIDDAKGLRVRGNHGIESNGQLPFWIGPSPFFGAWSLNCARFRDFPAAIVSPYSAKHNDIQLGFTPEIDTTLGCIPKYVPSGAVNLASPPAAFVTPVGGALPGWLRWQSKPATGYSGAGDLINYAYESCLGRPIEGYAASYWWGQAMAGVPETQLWARICSSDEFRRRVIAASYLSCYGRKPAASENSRWLQSFAAGATPEQVWWAICGRW